MAQSVFTDDESVRIEWIDGGEAIVSRADEHVLESSHPSRAQIAVVLAASALVLWTLARVASEPTTAEELSDLAPVAAAIDVGAVRSASADSPIQTMSYEQFPIWQWIHSPVQGDEGWLALHQGPGGNRLMRSHDGVDWVVADSAVDSADVLGLGRAGDRWRVLVSEAPDTASTYSSADGETWQFVEEHETTSDPSFVSLAGDTTVVVTMGAYESVVPDPMLVDLVSGLVDDDLAVKTCGLVRDQLFGHGFDVIDCRGNLLTSIGDPQTEEARQLTLAAYSLSFNHTISLTSRTLSAERIRLHPSGRIESIVATTDGFVAVVTDTIRDADASLFVWDGGGFLDVFEIPIELQAGYSRLGRQPDGTLTLLGSDAVAISSPPYNVWTTVARIPVDDAAGSTLSVSDDGLGLLFVAADGRVWLARTGGEWQRTPQLDDTNPTDILLATEADLIVVVPIAGLVGELVRVPLPDG